MKIYYYNIIINNNKLNKINKHGNEHNKVW